MGRNEPTSDPDRCKNDHLHGRSHGAQRREPWLLVLRPPSTYGRHLYELYRCGLIHERVPKVLRSATASTQLLGWALMYARVDRLGPHRGNVEVEHLRLQVVDNDLAVLPVSVLAIYEDFLTACAHFAGLLEAEAVAGGSELLTRWWQTWNALGSPEETTLTW